MKTLRILIYLLILVNLIFIGFFYSEYTGKATWTIETANITRIIDGDTFETDIGKIRLLGINTPEKKKPGFEEAKEFLSLYLGKEVELICFKECDDIYERKLRYIFYENRNLNEKILSLGLAHYYSYSEDKYTKDLLKAEKQARDKERGIWERSNNKCMSCIKLVELNEIDPGEYIILENKCDFDCDLIGWTIKDDTASHIKTLDFELKANSEFQINYEGRIWNDGGDSLYLRDESGKLVLFYRY